MIDLKSFKFRFVVGSQHLYGPATLSQADKDSREMAAGLNAALPCAVEYAGLVTTADEILKAMRAANADPACAGVILWMHTFSPSKMWIAGLSELTKPTLHFHTQYNAAIPWSTIDMDFMNLNQSAHGDREHGFIQTRLRRSRRTVVGHWKDKGAQAKIEAWMRAACAFADGKATTVARFGDNMREVAVTEGDKVEAAIRFGWTVDGYGIGEIAAALPGVSEAAVSAVVEGYRTKFAFAPEAASGAGLEAVKQQARIEAAMRAFLEARRAKAFTTTFEDLHGLPQLPGLAVQSLMADGYGFGGEGDWKTAALVRAMKVMSAGKKGGTSFMEDYTYHFDAAGDLVLGAHMLEVCPSIAVDKPRIEVHPLGIGGKADPARLVFEAAPGQAVNATVIDMGNRFRMIVNAVETVALPKPMPKLPVARAIWKPLPSLAVAAEAWLEAGGAHHTGYSTAIGQEELRAWAQMAGIEYAAIDGSTDPVRFADELRWSDAYWSGRP